jgi:hypothetical protein
MAESRLFDIGHGFVSPPYGSCVPSCIFFVDEDFHACALRDVVGASRILSKNVLTLWWSGDACRQERLGCRQKVKW